MAVTDGTAELRGMLDLLRTLPPSTDDSDRIDRLRLLQEISAATAAAQAVETVAFAASQRAAQAAAGMPSRRRGRGIAAQVGLALRCSPSAAQRFVGWAQVLTTELPATFTALREGRTTQWRTVLVARETGWLSRDDRSAVDAVIGPRLEDMADGQVAAETHRLALGRDQAGYVAHRVKAEDARRVSLRPAPETMVWLGALLPVAQGVAAYAALRRETDAAIGAGDGRTRGQLMADTLVERVTGQASAAAVAVEVELVMTDRALLAKPGTPGRDEPAELIGYGPVAADWARRLVLDRPDDTPTWLRRLYRRPGTGQLAAMDSRRRTFSADQRRFLRLRDRACRMPWCDAPIRHADHVVPAELGGRTAVANGQGLCAACNYAKQAPGWLFAVAPAGRICITTPTGHRYWHKPPDPPGSTTTQRARAAPSRDRRAPQQRRRGTASPADRRLLGDRTTPPAA